MTSDYDGIRLGKTLSFSWDIFQSNLLSLLALSCLNTLPTFGLQVFLLLNPINPGNIRAGLTALIAILAVVIIASCLALVSSLAIPALVENSVLDREVSLRGSLNTGFTKFMAGAVTALIASLIIFGLSLLLVIPGIIWMYYYVFLNESVALRNMKGMEALRYSKHLVKGNWWNVFWIVLVCVFLLSLIVWVPTVLTTFILGNSLLAHGVQLVLSTFAFAYFHVLRTLMFLGLECSRGIGVVRVPEK